ncbi:MULTISPECIES: amidohydrolase family protein [unclassified Bradyrhizobium]|uniref:amidohydrolase family protein n=2 Tax=unclassified Bradyrhizobium TaxID=2631580 RepID=UPI0028E2B6D6|nr:MULTISPECIES: amidohydrolase family protein [unclassified Bradyrhizobium]
MIDLRRSDGRIAVTEGLSAETKATRPIRKIALEEHYSTPELAKTYVARPTRSDTLFADIERRLADFDQLRLEAMDAAGIELSVLSVTTPGVQAVADTDLAIRLAREANDVLARQVQKRPHRYAGFAHLPTQDGVAAGAELERAVRELGFKGALINGQTAGHYLDADMYLPFWERVHDLDVPVYLHPGQLADQPAMFAGRPELDGPVWAWTADTAAHALRLVFAGTFKRFPRLKIILGHMGETLPHLLWRLDSRWEMELGEKLPRDDLPSTIIRRNIMITTSGVCDPNALVGAIAALGEDSVMFSVDYPYEDSTTAGAFIESAPISEIARAKVCHGNAEKILRL